MSFVVRLACEGTAVAPHPRMTMAVYEHSPATGWRRVERYADASDVRHLPKADEWASNTPGARFRERCGKCGRTPELAWDTLIPKLDAARTAGKSRVVHSYSD